MTRDEIIHMARQAHLPSCLATHPVALERFAVLVAANERLHGMKLLTDVLIDAAVKAEREACAKVAESMRPHGGRMFDEAQSASFSALTDCAAAIRARRQE
jgi:hypothetical protein